MVMRIDGNGFIDPLTNVVPTGLFAQFMLPSAPAGWIAGDGSTIGNVGSGATRANADTQALFLAWWAYSDAQLPILTNAGGPSTRGANALADWNAGKRLTVFDVRGRFPRNAGSINTLTFVNGTVYGDTLRNHSHTFLAPNQGGVGATFGGGGPPVDPGNLQTSTMNPAGAAETAPVSIAMLGCFKL